MDSDLAIYVITHYPHLLTVDERAAELHLAATYKATGGRSDVRAQTEARAEPGAKSRWLSDDPAVTALAAEGLEAFRARVAERILAERADAVFLNLCPACGGLTRTPQARLCLHCGHSWHGEAAPGQR